MINGCPIKIPKIIRMCKACMYSKEGVCDFPYTQDMTDEEIKQTAQVLASFKEHKIK